LSPDRPAQRYLAFLVIFVTGAGLGLAAWNFIKLPFENPWKIVGPLTLIHYNPSNTIIRFGLVVLLPSVLLLALGFLNIRGVGNLLYGGPRMPGFEPVRPERKSLRLFLALLLLFVALLVALNFPTMPADTTKMDTFHEGESLGPAVSYAKGEVPYKDFVFVHGPYEDPIRAVVAFKLFGRSIASVRTLQAINKVIAFLLLAFMLLKIFEGDYLYSFMALLLLVYLGGSLAGPFARMYTLMYFPQRDMTTFAFIIVVIYIADYIRRAVADRKRLFLLGALFSFVPVVSFAYSIDRGFYNGAAYAILLVLLFLFFFNVKGSRIVFLVSTAVGLFLGTIVLGWALRWDYSAFIRFAVLQMPKFKELMDGKLYPIWTRFGFTAVILIAINTMWVASRFLREWRDSGRKFIKGTHSFLSNYLLEFALLLISIFAFRSALGRSEFGHIAYSVSFTYVLSIVIVLKYYLSHWVKSLNARKVFIVVVAIILAVVCVDCVYRGKAKGLLTTNFPTRRHLSDAFFIPEIYQPTISFFKKNLSGDESFVTMTNEASWYYFVDKPSPTRFPVAWFAAPVPYQEEFVRQLKKGNVKYVLYRDISDARDMDGITAEKRLPIIFDYIHKNYRFLTNLYRSEIWVRRNPR